MTNDEIKHLMREQWATAILLDADVERIRNIIEAAVLAEREACALVCEERMSSMFSEMFDKGWNRAAEYCAKSIRARDEK